MDDMQKGPCMAGSRASSAALDRQTCPGVRDGALPPERSEDAAAARHGTRAAYSERLTTSVELCRF